MALQSEGQAVLERALAHQMLHVKLLVVRQEAPMAVDHLVETLCGDELNLPVGSQLALALQIDSPEAQVRKADVFVTIE